MSSKIMKRGTLFFFVYKQKMQTTLLKNVGNEHREQWVTYVRIYKGGKNGYYVLKIIRILDKFRVSKA